MTLGWIRLIPLVRVLAGVSRPARLDSGVRGTGAPDRIGRCPRLISIGGFGDADRDYEPFSASYLAVASSTATICLSANSGRATLAL